MKALFLLVTIICAISLSVLSVIYATGKIPLRAAQAVEVKKVEEKRANAAAKAIAAMPGQKELSEEMIAALKSEREQYAKKMSELAEREQVLKHEEDVLKDLTNQFTKVQTDLDTKMVEATAAESVNLKKLADIYSKMEPDSAASLLMDPTMTPERVARILSLLGERQAGAIMNSAISKGAAGTKKAAEWTDSLRKLKTDNSKAKKKG